MANENTEMDENTFWLRLWQSVIVGVVLAVATVGGCTAYESKRVADAIDRGAEPIGARCAIVGSFGGDSKVCVIKATRWP